MNLNDNNNNGPNINANIVRYPQDLSNLNPVPLNALVRGNFYYVRLINGTPSLPAETIDLICEITEINDDGPQGAHIDIMGYYERRFINNQFENWRKEIQGISIDPQDVYTLDNPNEASVFFYTVERQPLHGGKRRKTKSRSAFKKSLLHPKEKSKKTKKPKSKKRSLKRKSK
jgi:hypothetical protein